MRDPHAGAPGAWRVRVVVPQSAVPAVETALEDWCSAVAAYEMAEDSADWVVDGWADEAPEEAQINLRLALVSEAAGLGTTPRMAVEAFPAVDWLAQTYAGFPPLDLGRFRIQGSHVDGPPPIGRIALIIDAATAFGTGEHPTTEACLRALTLLHRTHRIDRRVGALDMGTGSGILAFAVAKMWKAPVLACDIDHESVRVGHINAAVNGVAPLVRMIEGDGYKDRRVTAKRYPLILANILAGPLVAMSPAAARRLAPGGRLVLSGLLTRQARQVIAAHRRFGLIVERRIVIGTWTTLILRRPGRKRRI